MEEENESRHTCPLELGMSPGQDSKEERTGLMIHWKEE